MSGAGAGGAGAMGAGAAAAAAEAEAEATGDGVALAQGPELVKQTSHIALGLSLLIEQFKDKPNIAATLRAYMIQVQELECVFLEQLFIERWLADAVGEQLDGLGRIVDEPRGGRVDDLYRVALGGRILVNNSRGTHEELITITKIVLDPADQGIAVEVIDYPPASLEIRALDEIIAVDPAAAFALIRLAVASGVRAFFLFKLSDDSFQFASQNVVPELDSSTGFGGGAFVGVID